MASSDNEGLAKPAVKKTTKKAMATTATATNKVSTMNMVAEALRSCEDKNGMSLSALKRYLSIHYPDTESQQGFKHRLKKAILKGLETGAFIRPAKSRECTGAVGSFKLAKPNPKATIKKSHSASPVVKPRKRSRSLSASPAKKSKTGEKAKPKKAVKPKLRSKSPATGKAKLSTKATDKTTAAKKKSGASKKSESMTKMKKSPKAMSKSPVAKAIKKTGVKKSKTT